MYIKLIKERYYITLDTTHLFRLINRALTLVVEIVRVLLNYFEWQYNFHTGRHTTSWSFTSIWWNTIEWNAFDRIQTSTRIPVYRPQTALSRATNLHQDRIGSREASGKAICVRVNTANSLDQHIRGLIWRPGRYVSRTVCPVTLINPRVPRLPDSANGRNCFGFCQRRVNHNCTERSNPMSNWVVSINKTEFSSSTKHAKPSVCRVKRYRNARWEMTAERMMVDEWWMTVENHRKDN